MATTASPPAPGPDGRWCSATPSTLDEYSPVESILASLAACSAMDVIGIANKKRQTVDRYEIHAVGEQRDEYPQVLTEVTVTHEVWGVDISESAFRRCIELSATKYCPVNAMLSAGATTVHHRYAIHTTATSGAEAGSDGPYRAGHRLRLSRRVAAGSPASEAASGLASSDRATWPAIDHRRSVTTGRAVADRWGREPAHRRRDRQICTIGTGQRSRDQ